ncbi:MAG: hypothetical protein ACEPO8_02515 [Rhodothermaceae bacterium]
MKILLTVLIFVIPGLAQTKTLDLKKDGNISATGFVVQEGIKLLITEKGIIPLDSEDPWQDYYRIIYKDSTIVNPNTIINSNSSGFTFFPMMDIDFEKFYKLPENSKVKDFFKDGLKGRIYFLPDKLQKHLEKENNKPKK